MWKIKFKIKQVFTFILNLWNKKWNERKDFSNKLELFIFKTAWFEFKGLISPLTLWFYRGFRPYFQQYFEESKVVNYIILFTSIFLSIYYISSLIDFSFMNNLVIFADKNIDNIDSIDNNYNIDVSLHDTTKDLNKSESSDKKDKKDESNWFVRPIKIAFFNFKLNKFSKNIHNIHNPQQELIKDYLNKFEGSYRKNKSNWFVKIVKTTFFNFKLNKSSKQKLTKDYLKEFESKSEDEKDKRTFFIFKFVKIPFFTFKFHKLSKNIDNIQEELDKDWEKSESEKREKYKSDLKAIILKVLRSLGIGMGTLGHVIVAWWVLGFIFKGNAYYDWLTSLFDIDDDEVREKMIIQIVESILKKKD